MEEKGEETIADDKSKNKTFKWKVKGRVVSRGISQSGIQGCTHPTLMKDMCAECGADLRENPGHAGARKEAVSASVAMVHSIPELIVSEEEALAIGRADEHRLLRTRKLVLLVDLDQTLIHTTNDNIPANLKGVYHFQLAHGSSVMWYHTRLRPHTEEFLKKISEMYELHICTFGVRLYAHTIATYLDPEGKYFSHRILSRDECFSFNSKIPNIKALFPCGDSMVAIIDDREDVWSYSPNLIHVKPYRFFQGTADINAPPGCTKTESDSDPVKHKVRRISHTSDGNSQVEEINPKTGKEVENEDSKTEGEVVVDDSKTKVEEGDGVDDSKTKVEEGEGVHGSKTKVEEGEGVHGSKTMVGEGVHGSKTMVGEGEGVHDSKTMVGEGEGVDDSKNKVEEGAEVHGSKTKVEGENEDSKTEGEVVGDDSKTTVEEGTEEGKGVDDSKTKVERKNEDSETEGDMVVDDSKTRVEERTEEGKGVDDSKTKVEEENGDSKTEGDMVVDDSKTRVEEGTEEGKGVDDSKTKIEEKNEDSKTEGDMVVDDSKTTVEEENGDSKTEGDMEVDDSKTRVEELTDCPETVVDRETDGHKTAKEIQTDAETSEVVQKNISNNSEKQSEAKSEKEDTKCNEGENKNVCSKQEKADSESVCNTEVVTVMDSESESKSLTGEEEKDYKDDSAKLDTEESKNKGDNVETVSEEIEWVDEDDYLYHLEEILTRVHKAFYDVYDQMTVKGNADKMPDMKSLLPYVKKKVLKGVNIVFSGVFPTNMPPEKSRAYLVARSLGANIHTNFVLASSFGEGDTSDHTTHVIAARLGTVKVRSAQKSRTAFLVTPDWLWCCNDRWERVDERLFALTADTQSVLPIKRCSPDVVNQELKNSESMKRKNETPAEEVFVYDRVTGKRIQPNKRQKNPDIETGSFSAAASSRPDDENTSELNETGTSGETTHVATERFSKSYNPLYALSTEDIANMDREVAELMDDDDDESDNGDVRVREEVEDAGMDPKEERELRRKVLGKPFVRESSSEEDSMTGDFPRGWQLKRKLSKIGKLKVLASPERVSNEDESSVDPEDNENIEIDSEDEMNGKQPVRENDSDDSNDSIGSIDDIIAEAVQKEFLS